ncbi:hypothetical protein EWM64_g4474 [Hericium alpestre]|uniref:Uncharacterized protein n=1 Tax=Hericium alpestre TaxID=135208 RepID=A0A4Z0A1E3_9AGAM|nr:hypothetical protein EWM64_g4474 [Hericium alpestre]
MSQDADLTMYNHTPLVNADFTFHFDGLEDFARKEKVTLIREHGESMLRQRVKMPTPPLHVHKLSKSLGMWQQQHGSSR